MTKLKLNLQSFGRRRGHRHDSPAAVENSLSTMMMEETLGAAEVIISKWDPEASAYAKITSLFYEDRSEAGRFLAVVDELHRTMMSFVSTDSPRGSKHGALVHAQKLMEAAMRRLQKEFYQILAANRDHLDPESVSARSSVSCLSDVDGAATDCDSPEDDTRIAGESIKEVESMATAAMTDLRAIAETMINAGYGKECVKIYNILRKSIVEEGLYRLGFEPLTASQVQKLDWQVLDLRIRSWLGASRAAVKTLFCGERVLLDNVFSSSEAIREVIFSGIAGEAAVQFLAFPEQVAKTKRSPEKIFRLLDLFDAVSELWPELEPVFSFVSTAGVRTQVLNSLFKLAEAIRGALAEFETSIQKESSKTPAPGAGVHPLTRYAMKYLTSLADYESVLIEIFAGVPLQSPTSLPDDFIPALPLPTSSSSSSSPAPSYLSMSTSSNDEKDQPATVNVRLAWLLLVLLCKLDGKAALYKDVSSSYLFLANNMFYIVNKVRGCRLHELLGEKWAAQHAAKARQYAAAYERMAWGKVAATVPAGEVTAGEAREKMRAFNAAFEEVMEAQAGAVVADEGMREVVRAAVIGMVVPAYRGFFERWRTVTEVKAVVRFTPENVRRRLGELFASSDLSGSDGFNSDSNPFKAWHRPCSSEGSQSDRTIG